MGHLTSGTARVTDWPGSSLSIMPSLQALMILGGTQGAGHAGMQPSVKRQGQTPTLVAGERHGKWIDPSHPSNIRPMLHGQPTRLV